MIKVINNKNRGVLSEGRNYQMGFAFVKRGSPLCFETVQPISPCKDYLNDVVYTEHTGKSMEAYGLLYAKQSIFGKKYGYLVVSICDKNGMSYGNFEKDRENLRENFKKIERFINLSEQALRVSGRTQIKKTDNPDIFLVRCPLYWCQYTYLISLYSLLLRVSQWYDRKQCWREYLDHFDKFSEDIYLINTVRDKIYKLVEKASKGEDVPVQDLNSMKSDTSTHNCGIMSFAL